MMKQLNDLDPFGAEDYQRPGTALSLGLENIGPNSRGRYMPFRRCDEVEIERIGSSVLGRNCRPIAKGGDGGIVSLARRDIARFIVGSVMTWARGHDEAACIDDCRLSIDLKLEGMSDHVEWLVGCDR